MILMNSMKSVDLVQINKKHAKNFTLLKEVGARVKKPILLKRGLMQHIRNGS